MVLTFDLLFDYDSCLLLCTFDSLILVLDYSSFLPVVWNYVSLST